MYKLTAYHYSVNLGSQYPASSWFLLRQMREKPLRATIRPFELTTVQRHGQLI